MNEKVKQDRNSRIFRNYVKRIALLLRANHFEEAAEVTHKFGGICAVWEHEKQQGRTAVC